MNGCAHILIAGAHGMVGSSLVRRLRQEGHYSLLTPGRQELDFRDQKEVRSYLSFKRPDVVIIAAAKVGGIFANMTYPAEFMYDNLMIASNLIHESHKANINRLLFLGSTCIYPRMAPQPIPESALLTGPLEKTNEAYALAKIAGVKLCQFYQTQYGRDYIAAMPTNLYGPNDNYHVENAHVIPALLRRFHEAKVSGAEKAVLWGSGEAKREFLFVDDLAEALIFLLQHYHDDDPINVGSEEECTLNDLASLIAQTVGYTGRIEHDFSKPDGTHRKKSDLMRVSALGWSAKTPLAVGLKTTYADFLSKISSDRGLKERLRKEESESLYA